VTGGAATSTRCSLKVVRLVGDQSHRRPYVFAAIYVNGKLVARDEDRSTYGYGSAQAM